MKNFKRTIRLLLLVSFITGCATIKNTNNKEKGWKPRYKLQAGINHGGIVENNDLSVLEGSLPDNVDAYTGATKLGANVGAHMILPVRKNSFEIGVDYMLNNQTFTYTNQSNYVGDRETTTSQFLFPITYNIGFFRKIEDEGLFRFKFGYVFQANLFGVSDKENGLPNYSTEAFSNGVTLGFDTTPYKLKNGAKLGFFIDLYRGSQIYEDVFNQKAFEKPGSSYIKAGIIYQLKN